MTCTENIKVTKLELRDTENENYIDLFNDFRIYQSSLSNGISRDVTYYGSIGAGFSVDSELLIQQSMQLAGTIPVEGERQYLSFLSALNKRYKLIIEKNGKEYFRYIKLGNLTNDYRNRGVKNDISVEVICETPWLIEKSFDIVSGELPETVAEYGNGFYDTENNVYIGYNIGQSTDVKVFTLSSDYRVHWKFDAITSGDDVTINLNGNIIQFKNGTTFTENQLLQYCNIPYYSEITLDGSSSIITALDFSKPIFEVYMMPNEQNFIIFSGIKEAVVTYYESYGVI